MGVSCFDGIGGLCQFSEDNPTGELIKNALVLIEGTHKDNQGVVHEFPSERILRIAQRTNAAMSQGYEIPLMSDHSKQLIGADGELKKLGIFVSPFECRVIRQEDLPNPKMQHLIGKLGAFSRVNILNKVNEVRSKLINLLSPGVDLKLERLAEVSAVAFPAIHGPALFAASSTVQDLSFASVKEEQGTFKRQREDLLEEFEILLQTIQRIQKASPEQLVAVTPEQLLSTAIDEFTAEIKQYFGLDNLSQSINQEPESPYNSSPYANELIKGQATYSLGNTTSNFSETGLRRRKKNR
jgi:hypothetical protein